MFKSIALALSILASSTLTQELNPKIIHAKVVLVIEIVVDNATYEKTDPDDKKYMQIDVEQQSKSYEAYELFGQIFAEDLQAPTFNDSFPGGSEAKPGTSFLVLKKGWRDTVYVNVHMALERDGEKPEILKYRARGRFITGDWDSYQAGDNVHIELAEKGERKRLDAFNRIMSHNIRDIERSDGINLPEVSDFVRDNESKTYIQGNLESITMRGALLRLAVDTNRTRKFFLYPAPDEPEPKKEEKKHRLHG